MFIKNIKRRNSTLELLRILSMIGVLGLHYMNRKIGGVLNTTVPVNIWTSHFIESICITSVNVFVLISGYFMIKQKTTGLRKAIELYLIMLLYHLVFFAVGITAGEVAFSWKELAVTMFPFAIGQKWFLETYILLLLFAPFINILIEHLNKKTHLLFISIWILVFSVWASFLPSPPLTDGGYGITNFITLYLIAAYIKKYVSLPKNNKSVLLALLTWIISVLVITASSFTFLKGRAWDYCYIFNIIASTAVFYAFLNLPETYIPVINTVAGLTFGVYISHANVHLQNIVYHKVMHTERFMDHPAMPLHFVICVVLQFTFFALIEYLRQIIWKPTVGKYLKNSNLLKAEQLWELHLFDN